MSETCGMTYEGTTVDGLAVRITDDRRVYIDGVEQHPGPRDWRGWPRTLRDGGTRIFECEHGKLTLPHRLGSDDLTPRWRPA